MLNPFRKLGMYRNDKGYLRIFRGPLKGKYAHRAYVERQLGRQLLPNEQVHHLCRNPLCWPPSDFHLLVLDKRLHASFDSGVRPNAVYRERTCGTNVLFRETDDPGKLEHERGAHDETT
jgi:hypothetical protein